MDSLLQIRYCKLYFKLEFLENTHLPVHKVSMIRGGVGEMLLRGNCIGGRDCENCSFREECVIQQIYYHKLKIVPDYVQGKESLGYVYECGDRRTDFRQGDILEFQLTLFGNVIVHFPVILQAVYLLGVYGMGKEKARFRPAEVENQRGEKVLLQDNVCLSYLKPKMIAEYATGRRNGGSEGGRTVKIHFVSPLTQKYEGQFLREFQEQALVYSIYRRVYLLNCMEGNAMERRCPFPGAIEIVDQRVRTEKIPRYSSTHDKVIGLEGIVGEAEIKVEKEFLPFLFAGELAHIGKNTSMGFGQYVVE